VNTLNNHGGESGFSLLEILVALGIVGIISVMVGSLMQNNKKFSRNLQGYNEIEDLTNQLNHQSQILDVCNVNFPPGTTIPFASNKTTFLDSLGNILFSSSALGLNENIASYYYNIGYADVTTKEEVRLTITFTTGSNTIGANTLTRSFPLFVSFDTTSNTITGCISMDENYDQTVLDQACLGTGAIADNVSKLCYHAGLDQTSCATNTFVHGFYYSPSEYKYKFSPEMCVPKTGMIYHAPCMDNQLLMGFSALGVFSCLPITATQLYVGFDQVVEACAGSVLTLNKNSPTGPVDIDCSGAAVPTPIPTVAACTMPAEVFFGSNTSPTRQWGDGIWQVSGMSSSSGHGWSGILSLGAPYANYLKHENDISAFYFASGVSGDMNDDMIYSFNFDTTNPPDIGAFTLEDITSGNYSKITYYTRAVSTQETDPSKTAAVYGTITCKYTFTKTAATTYQYTINMESCDPASGVNPVGSSGPTSFTYTPGSTSINLGNKFVAGIAPACGISIVQAGLFDSWPHEYAAPTPPYNYYVWTWVTASQANGSFNAPNNWQKQLRIVGGDWNSASSASPQTKGVLDDFKICTDTVPATGASAMCSIP
jgi:prepilin-type N-terminal cleavage/methylation domain-containing protein